MKQLKKAKRLHPHDRIAIISCSSGMGGDPELRWRYELGIKRLKEVFQLEVVPMPHALKGSTYVYEHPEKRAQDLMDAFRDPTIHAILCMIGGEDSIRMLPYIDFDVIAQHPKILSGFSDSTVLHLMCLKAGISSFYGPALLKDFAEFGAMSQYTVDAIRRTWFSSETIGEIKASDTWTCDPLPWDIENKDRVRKFQPNHPYEVLQGSGKVQGRLIGGCMEVLEYCKGTSLFPEISQFEDTILFLETSEVQAPPWLFQDEFRCYGMMGILSRVKGIIFGKPQAEAYYEEYKQCIKKICKEFGLEDLVIFYNGSFGHNEPRTILPYGVLAQLDCDTGSFTILESAVE